MTAAMIAALIALGASAPAGHSQVNVYAPVTNQVQAPVGQGNTVSHVGTHTYH